MTDDYTKSLEKRIEELEDVVTSYNPTTFNILKTIVDVKMEFFKNNNIKYGHNGLAARTLLSELCTVKFCLGRQMGHTTALYALYKKDPIHTTLIFSHKMMVPKYKGAIHFSDFVNNGSTLTSKLILFDNYLTYKPSSDLCDEIEKRVVQQGVPPVIILT